jgi:hypothetical protein
MDPCGIQKGDIVALNTNIWGMLANRPFKEGDTFLVIDDPCERNSETWEFGVSYAASASNMIARVVSGDGVTVEFYTCYLERIQYDRDQRQHPPQSSHDTERTD